MSGEWFIKRNYNRNKEVVRSLLDNVTAELQLKFQR